MADTVPANVIGKLREPIASLSNTPTYKEIVEPRDAVLAANVPSIRSQATRRPDMTIHGYEYPCDVGRIDLLAKHKREPRWLVIELKRNQTSDQTSGRLLRYIGWVKRHLASEGDVVCGMIICREADDALHYALSTVPMLNFDFMRWSFT